MIDPDYPLVLRDGHFEGQVHLEATVLANGSVTHVDIRGGNPMLAEYASKQSCDGNTPHLPHRP